MATFLFWNLNRRPALEPLSALVREHEVDVLALAECSASDGELLTALNSSTPKMLSVAPGYSARLKILIAFPRECCRPLHDSGGIAIRHLVPPVGTDIILVAVHLGSKLHKRDVSQAMHCTRLMRYVEEAEENVGHRRTIIAGDLNMNPFEFGVVCAAGMHAVMTRAIAARGSRVVQQERRDFFYNPMWGTLGDASPGPPGTYYYDSGEELNYYWNVFDQVLLRPDVLSMCSDDAVRVVTTAGRVPLMSDDQRPTPSDHLPVLFDINLHKE